MERETSQSLSNAKWRTPNFDSAGFASTISRTKKKAISNRIPAASAVSTQRSSRSGSLARSGRSRGERPLPAIEVVVASTAMRRSGSDRAAVAGQRARGVLRLGEQLARELRVLELGELVLPVAEQVLQEGAHRLGVALLHAERLAGVLVGVDEGLRGDRVGGLARRVDRRDAEIRRDRETVAGRGGGLERGSDVAARLVLDRGRGEAVRERVGLLDVADRAVG